MAETLSIREAAERVGCSDKTIRKRIKAGELSAMKKDGPYGEEYRIPAAELARYEAYAFQGARQGSSTVGEGVENPSPAAGRLPGQQFAETILSLTEQLREQAEELGRYKAISERAASLEQADRELRAEREALAAELAQTKQALEALQQQAQAAQAKRGRWFGLARRAGR